MMDRGIFRESPRPLRPVLLVEDDAVAVAVVRRCMEMSGLQNPLLSVSDGLEARNYLFGVGPYCDRFRDPLPIVIVLDLEVPTIGGLDLLTSIREREDLASIPAVILSGSTNADQIERAHALGARSFLVKPVGFNALTDVMTTLRGRWAILEPAPPGSRVRKKPTSEVFGEYSFAANKRFHKAERGEEQLAIRMDDLEVHFQPIVDLETRQTRSVEALARLRLSNGELLQPDSFIPGAEETGEIVELGRRVLRTACLELRRWRNQERTAADVTISVNVSPVQLGSGRLVSDVLDALDRTSLPASALVLEVTESIADDGQALEKLGALHDVGVGVAIDDFGTGYSSISYLRALPVDSAKIDKSLTEGIGNDPDQWSLVRAVAGLIASAGLVVVAEGIEHADQLTHLRALGCDLGQGFHFAHPVPAGEIPGYLAHHPLPLAELSR